MLLFNLAGFAPRSTRSCGCRACCRSTRRASAPSPPDLAFNTAVSFVTNTNWQNYGGETTMSHLTQMAGLTVQNFVSAATGIARRRRARSAASPARSADGIGNFWVDLTRVHALRAAAALDRARARPRLRRACRRPSPARSTATTLEGARQTIAHGPVASQVAIKMLGTNGGGFFNANSAHPFENPTPLSNFVQMVAIFALGAALTNIFGRMVGDERQGWAILAAMGVLFLAGVAVAYWAEAHGNPLAAPRSASTRPAATWRARRSASASSLSALFAVDHHRRLLRRGQRHARQLHAARRPDPAGQHAARRGRSSAASAPASTACCSSSSSRLHRRADGRPHAGISRQEDRGARGQDGRCSRILVPAARHARLHRARRRAADGRRVDRSTPARTASPRSSTPTPRRRRTTARPSAGSPATRPSTT